VPQALVSAAETAMASTLSRRLGYRLAGVREDEDAAQALGIPSRR